MTTTTQEPTPKLRWFQIGLRLALIVLLCWIGLRLQRARANRKRVAAVEYIVAVTEGLSDDVKGQYEVRRSQTWLEELFDDPGDVDDPVGVLKIKRWVPPPTKREAHFHNKALINDAVETYFLATGQWPSNDLHELKPPTTYHYFPDGFPINPLDGSSYTIDETTRRVTP